MFVDYAFLSLAENKDHCVENSRHTEMQGKKIYVHCIYGILIDK